MVGGGWFESGVSMLMLVLVICGYVYISAPGKGNWGKGKVIPGASHTLLYMYTVLVAVYAIILILNIKSQLGGHHLWLFWQ